MKTFVVAVCVVVVMAATACGRSGLECAHRGASGETLPEMLDQLAADPAVYSFELASVTPFAWDTVYVFDAYDTPDLIKRSTGVEYSPGVLDSSVPEGSQVLVFVRDGDAVCSFEQTASGGQDSWMIGGLSSPWKSGIPARDSRLLVERTTGYATVFSRSASE
jgi:hypothetical protein